MEELADNSVTRLLNAVGQGEAGARDKLLAAVYEQLHVMARGRMAHEAPGRVLQTTALVHEAYLRLFPGGGGASFENRKHFFGAAAEAMRRILVDDARKRNRLKRCPESAQQEGTEQTERDGTALLDVDEALTKLEAIDHDAAEVVKQFYFLGMGVDEIAEVQGVSPRAVDNWLRSARALLRGLLVDGYG